MGSLFNNWQGGLAHRVMGMTVYGVLDDHWYAEVGSYLSRPVSQSNPGGKMKYDGLQDARALDDLLAYLQTVK